MAEKGPRRTHKGVIEFTTAGLLFIALVGAFAVPAYVGYFNKANAIEEEENIFKEQGLIRPVPLIDNQGYFKYSKLNDVKMVEFNLEEHLLNGVTQSVTVNVPKRNIIPNVINDPNFIPTVLFKPDNFVVHDGGFFPRYAIINKDNSKMLYPTGEVTIFLSQKEKDKLEREK